MLLACSDLSQSVGKPFFLHFKLNDTDKKSLGSPREKNSQLPVAVRVSKTSVLKLPITRHANLVTVYVYMLRDKLRRHREWHATSLRIALDVAVFGRKSRYSSFGEGCVTSQKRTAKGTKATRPLINDYNI